jgi:hypothetical protein
MRGSRAISAHIDDEQRTRRNDALSQAEARANREKARADTLELRIAELESTLKDARRSVVILRGTLQCEREERRAQVETMQGKLDFCANHFKHCQGIKRAS